MLIGDRKAIKECIGKTFYCYLKNGDSIEGTLKAYSESAIWLADCSVLMPRGLRKWTGLMIRCDCIEYHSIPEGIDKVLEEVYLYKQIYEEAKRSGNITVNTIETILEQTEVNADAFWEWYNEAKHDLEKEEE